MVQILLAKNSLIKVSFLSFTFIQNEVVYDLKQFTTCGVNKMNNCH